MEPSDPSLPWPSNNKDDAVRPSNPQPFKFRKRDESKPIAHSTPKRAKSPASVLPAPTIAVQAPKSPTSLETVREEGLEDTVAQVEAIMKSLDTFQQEMKTLLKIDVKTPREEDLEKLIQRNDSAGEVLNRLKDSVRVAEERAAAERRSLLETEQEDSQLLQEAREAMDASISELNRELKGLQGISSMYERVSGLRLESQGSSKVRGTSLTPSRPFVFELDLSPDDTRYRNVTKSSEHLDAFLQHEISSLRNSELPMLFRRMLRALHPLDN